MTHKPHSSTNTLTLGSVLPLAGAILLTPQTLYAQSETAEPIANLNDCYHVCCLCTCQGPEVCDIWDFLHFQNEFISGNPCVIDLDTSTGVGVGDVFDFLVFQRDFINGILFGFRC